MIKLITERALRYDLTIPFARYVAMHHNELSFPFRRYQIQPVWRADRPQKGRYREFCQCDADVVGSRSLMNEVELTQIYLNVFEKLKVEVEVRINHRKILAALADACGGPEKLISITTAIDKLDKIGMEKVKQELAEKDLTADQISVVQKYLGIKGTNTEKLLQLEDLLNNAGSVQQQYSDKRPDTAGKADHHSSIQGISDIQKVLDFFPDSKNIAVDLSLARGLNYYTGIIYEVRARRCKHRKYRRRRQVR